MNIVDKYCFYNFGNIGYNTGVKLNLTAFNYIYSYVIDKTFDL